MADVLRGRRYKRGFEPSQPMLLPPSVEDYIAEDNPARAIGVYVDLMVDVGELGFKHGAGAGGAGQPAYDPADLLKLYLYGDLNRVHSSRRLAAECQRNLEVMWLLNGLQPGYHTIADFRKDNAKALKAVNRQFVLLCRELGLYGGTRVGLDGSFFNGNASAGSIKTKQQLERELAALERDIERYHEAIDTADAGETSGPAQPTLTAEQLAALQERARRRRDQLEVLAETGETQLSRTDPDVRRLTKNGKQVTGYNVQIVVDDRHGLILTHEVTNAGNDYGQLTTMAEQSRQALADNAPEGAQVPSPEMLADGGYFTEAEIAACEARGITVYVPLPEKKGSAHAEGRLPGSAFRYDAELDVYICPAGRHLAPSGQPAAKNGVLRRRDRSDERDCRACPQRDACLPEKTPSRQIDRSEHADAVDRHRTRMAASPEAMRQRAALCEHPFGTMKRWLGWDHFLVRGFEKVRGEMALLVHGYNVRRLLSLFGVAGFIALCRAHRDAGADGDGLGVRFWGLPRVLERLREAIGGLAACFRQPDFAVG